MWYKLARELKMPLQDCMRSHTSSEFVEWNVALQILEWEEHGKLEYYLAQIAAEIRIIREGFAKDPKSVSPDDCLIKFERADAGVKAAPVTPARQADKVEADDDWCDEDEADDPPAEQGYEPGPDLVQDPKWAAVNANAYAIWSARLGVNLTEL